MSACALPAKLTARERYALARGRSLLAHLQRDGLMTASAVSEVTTAEEGRQVVLVEVSPQTGIDVLFLTDATRMIVGPEDLDALATLVADDEQQVAEREAPGALRHPGAERTRSSQDEGGEARGQQRT